MYFAPYSVWPRTRPLNLSEEEEVVEARGKVKGGERVKKREREREEKRNKKTNKRKKKK